MNSPGIRRGRGGFAWKDVSGNEMAEAKFRLEGGGEGVCKPLRGSGKDPLGISSPALLLRKRCQGGGETLR